MLNNDKTRVDVWVFIYKQDIREDLQLKRTEGYLGKRESANTPRQECI